MLHVDIYKILLALSNNYARDKDFHNYLFSKALYSKPNSRGVEAEFLQAQAVFPCTINYN